MQGWDHASCQHSKKFVAEANTSGVTVKEPHKRISRECRGQLEKEVEKLQIKLKQEVETHKALERAFKRTLGVLPRFSSCLTPKVQALVAEVAVLEEEVINLEECIVTLRQCLYTEAVCLSTAKQWKEASSNLLLSSYVKEGNGTKLPQLLNGKRGKKNSIVAKLLPTFVEDKAGDSNKRIQTTILVNENINVHPYQQGKPKFNHSLQTNTQLEQGMVFERETVQKQAEAESLYISLLGENMLRILTAPKMATSHLESRSTLEPNLLSEEMVWCISHIFLKLTRPGSFSDCETLSAISESTLSSFWTHTSKNSFSCNPSADITEELQYTDPYRIFSETAPRDVGPYRYYYELTASSLDYSRIPKSAHSLRKLMLLVEKLAMVDLHGLTHKQKLAFWINIYNVCMMHAFLEHGIPSSPQQVVALMGKAAINVGGHHLSALAIEHFILRLPSGLGTVECTNPERETESSTYGLEWPEPLVSFALCCGSWSSPAVRIYTPLEVHNELQVAKAEYLQAAVGIAPTKVVIPKLLDWYMQDFAKDVESLIEWLLEQLPRCLGNSIKKLIASKHGKTISEVVEVMPHDFNFRYLFALQPL